ncbi:hypothetical protein IAG15_19080, partial [Enterococcus faecalis]|nr:hypothetical protein [Enterococcus faecalis]
VTRSQKSPQGITFLKTLIWTQIINYISIPRFGGMLFLILNDATIDISVTTYSLEDMAAGVQRTLPQNVKISDIATFRDIQGFYLGCLFC